MSRPLHIVVPQEFAAELSSALSIPHEMRTISDQSDEEIAQIMADTDVLVSGAFKAAWANNQQKIYPRLVQAVGAGLDGIDLSALPPGCQVCNVYGHERAMAEQTFLLLLALHKRLLTIDKNLRKGDWTPELPYLPELRHHHLLILGLGHIGQELVRWGKFLDMEISVVTRTPSSERGEKLGLRAIGGFGQLRDFLREADFVVVAIPATDESVDMIGTEEFAHMKQSACLINVGRARVVNEEALYQALSTRCIRGAGLDVWYQYPTGGEERQLPSHFPFHELDNVVMSAHKPTLETMAYRWKTIAENIARFAQDEPLLNHVCTYRASEQN